MNDENIRKFFHHYRASLMVYIIPFGKIIVNEFVRAYSARKKISGVQSRICAALWKGTLG